MSRKIKGVFSICIAFCMMFMFSCSSNAHTHNYVRGSTTLPTCAEKGYTTYTCDCGDTYNDDYVDALGHTFSEQVISPTCTERGYTIYTCHCGYTIRDNFIETLGHSYDANDKCALCGIDRLEADNGGNGSTHVHVYLDSVTAPTCKDKGYTTHTCECGDNYIDNYVSAVDHVYVSGKCKWCNADEPIVVNPSDYYTRVNKDGTVNASGDYISFGSYPQTDVTSTMSSVLSYGALPTSTTLNGWTDYGYYVDGEVQSYMWYKDVTYSGEKYRAVYFTSYRMLSSYNSPTMGGVGTSYQDDNGYYINTVYWFKFEPIIWRILSEDANEALLLSEMILDSQTFQNRVVKNENDVFYATDSQGSVLTDGNGNRVYANNYAYSTIRSWLNTDFYNAAFNVYQRQIVLAKMIDNSASTTKSDENIYACEDTLDKTYLISYKDFKNTSYGFSTEKSAIENQKKNTDYAKIQGCSTSAEVGYENNGNWWLRSPNYLASDVVSVVSSLGNITNYIGGVTVTYCGVVPALNIKLK